MFRCNTCTYFTDLNDVLCISEDKKGRVPTNTPPPNELSLTLFVCVIDTRDLMLQLGEKIRLPSHYSTFGHILTKIPCAMLCNIILN